MLELNRTITEIKKNVLERLNSSFEEAKERIFELELFTESVRPSTDK